MLKKILLILVSFHLVSCSLDQDKNTPNINPIDNEAFELIHYWNFNNGTTSAFLITPTVSLAGSPSLTYNGNFDSVNPGSGINLREENEVGNAIRLRNPSGSFIIEASTSGFEHIIMRYAVTRTGSGSNTHRISYSIDGIEYTNLGLATSEFTITEDDYMLVHVDFNSIAGSSNNTNFKIKIDFDAVSGTINNGNNRIDNLSFDGIPIEGVDPIVPDDDLYLLHYWDFNNVSSDEALISPITGNGNLTYLGNYFDSVTPGSDLNLRNESIIGTGLRLRNASGDFIISIPTTGHQNIQLQYAATRTGSGSQTQTVFYSTDGVNYTQSGLEINQFTITEDIYNLINIDFSNIQAVDNNPNFKVKIVFDAASAGIANGNNRIDNLSVEGNVL